MKSLTSTKSWLKRKETKFLNKSFMCSVLPKLEKVNRLLQINTFFFLTSGFVLFQRFFGSSVCSSEIKKNGLLWVVPSERIFMLKCTSRKILNSFLGCLCKTGRINSNFSARSALPRQVFLCKVYITLYRNVVYQPKIYSGLPHSM